MSDRPSSPRDIALEYLASFDERDPDRIASHVADDFENIHTSALGASCLGRTAYRERLPDFLASLPDLHFEPETVVVDDDEVAVFYTMTGRWQGDRAFSVRGVQRLRVADGKITQRTDYWDSAVFLRQVDDDAASSLADLGLA